MFWLPNLFGNQTLHTAITNMYYSFLLITNIVVMIRVSRLMMTRLRVLVRFRYYPFLVHFDYTFYYTLVHFYYTFTMLFWYTLITLLGTLLLHSLLHFYYTFLVHFYYTFWYTFTTPWYTFYYTFTTLFLVHLYYTFTMLF